MASVSATASASVQRWPTLDEDGQHARARPHGHPDGLAAVDERGRAALVLAQIRVAADEDRLGDADGGPVQQHAEVAREPEAARVRAAVGVQHEHVGERAQALERGQQSRDLAEAEQARDVRERDRPLPDRLVDDAQRRRVEHDDGRADAVLAHAHVQPADGSDGGHVERRLANERLEAALHGDGLGRREVERVRRRSGQARSGGAAGSERRNLRGRSGAGIQISPTGSAAPMASPAARKASPSGRPSAVQTASRPSSQSESAKRCAAVSERSRRCAAWHGLVRVPARDEHPYAPRVGAGIRAARAAAPTERPEADRRVRVGARDVLGGSRGAAEGDGGGGIGQEGGVEVGHGCGGMPG